MKQIKLIDIETCDCTMSQLMNLIGEYRKLLPEYDVFVDGQEYAVVARKRRD